MIEIIEHSILDSLNLLPFLLVAFLFIELIEHKLSKKSKEIISKSGKFGPLLGGLLGAFPQCGFSVMATNLYVTRIVSLGTLIAIYLSTSDEMLPILLSQNVEFNVIIKLIGLKVIIGMFFGFIIDFILRKRKQEKINYDLCDDDHCDCKHNLFLSSLKHTLKTFCFILLVTFVLNLLLHTVGEENIPKIFLKDSFFGPFLASLVGLIPNCASSVMITELYLSNAITLGSAMAGLLTGSGVALLVLFKQNKSLKENISILLLVYFLGVFSGIIIDIIGVLL